MEINNIALGNRIRIQRKKRGMSQMLLAEKLKLSATHISYIENGYRSLSLDAFVLLANVLNCTADELLEDSLENTVKVVNHEFNVVISDCTEYERRILLEVLQATKTSLRENRPYFRTKPRR